LLAAGYRYVPLSFQADKFEDVVIPIRLSYVSEPADELDDVGDEEPYYSINGIRNVFSFERLGPQTRETLRIQIVVTSICPLDCILCE
jgi:hypothetical protein